MAAGGGADRSPSLPRRFRNSSGTNSPSGDVSLILAAAATGSPDRRHVRPDQHHSFKSAEADPSVPGDPGRVGALGAQRGPPPGRTLQAQDRRQVAPAKVQDHERPVVDGPPPEGQDTGGGRRDTRQATRMKGGPRPAEREQGPGEG